MWRPATPADDPAIVRMCLALYAEDPSPERVSAARIRRTLATLRRTPARGRAVVLDAGGEVAGYALLVAFWSNELGGTICTIDELYVVPAHRARGHAGALLRALARGSGPWPRGTVALELEVTPGNARALRLYERLGFRAKKNRTLRRRSAR